MITAAAAAAAAATATTATIDRLRKPVSESLSRGSARPAPARVTPGGATRRVTVGHGLLAAGLRVGALIALRPLLGTSHRRTGWRGT